MSRLMVSVSGIRGVVGDTFTPPVIQKYVAAFGKIMGKKIVVGRDSRVTGSMVEHLVIGTLNAIGCDVSIIGICPTPTVQLAVENLHADGGIAITASHNPIEWNALKLIDPDGLFLDEESSAAIVAGADSTGPEYVTWDKIGRCEEYPYAIRDHKEAIFNLPYVDVPALRKRRFRVALDCVNGAGAVFLPEFLRDLGCEVVELNTVPNGMFPHTPEPVPENLTGLINVVKSNSVDVAFAVDPDSDRLAILSEKGEPLVEEYTLALAVKFFLAKKPGTVVVNASTTRAIDDIVHSFGEKVIRTKVGEVHVAKRIREEHAVIGGEGNGGVILPDVHLGRDAPVAVALTLQHLLEFGKPISELRAGLPQYVIVKKKIKIGRSNPDEILAGIKENHEYEQLDLIDGVKINREKSWLQLRKSNTEPIIRVFAEAPTREQAEAESSELFAEVKKLIIPSCKS